MGHDNLLDVKVRKQKVKVIKHNPKISEPMLKYSSTGHCFANTNSTLTASFSAQYQYTAHGSATVFIQLRSRCERHWRAVSVETPVRDEACVDTVPPPVPPITATSGAMATGFRYCSGISVNIRSDLQVISLMIKPFAGNHAPWGSMLMVLKELQ
jgi:hypothetical protein